MGAANISTTPDFTPDFGRLPDGQRFGLVPAWVLKLPDVPPGPKALYASLCTNADEHGRLWRSLARVAAEFNVTKRQLRRWVSDLAAAGLIVRNWGGIPPNYLVARDPEGRAWARSCNVKRTAMSSPADKHVPGARTPIVHAARLSICLAKKRVGSEQLRCRTRARRAMSERSTPHREQSAKKII